MIDRRKDGGAFYLVQLSISAGSPKTGSGLNPGEAFTLKNPFNLISANICA
jgi:hypothetical protein